MASMSRAESLVPTDDVEAVEQLGREDEPGAAGELGARRPWTTGVDEQRADLAVLVVGPAADQVEAEVAERRVAVVDGHQQRALVVLLVDAAPVDRRPGRARDRL